MGWEKRKRGDRVRGYFYQSVRVPGRPRPVKKYWGRKTAGQLVAADIEQRRQFRLAARAAEQTEGERNAPADALAGEVQELVEALATAWMLLAGFRNHRGEWRRRRER